VTQQVLHLDFISLSSEAGPDDRSQILEAAAQLAALPQVVALGAIEADVATGSDFDLAFYFLLPEFTALEPFGTDTRYAGFLQGAVAPHLRAFAGADVRLEAGFAAAGANAACLAIAAPEETYDWEVSEALQAWCEATGAACSATGLAVGEKQLYRGAALVFGDAPAVIERPAAERFHSTLIAGTARPFPART
jgi:hypothetical protein